ncbi:MAG: ATP-binding cassette domain-containing protein, partial [Gammaproteobacteria bacterium]|nr:ATP-binding cassette domain-containing protein [Gammaproteobacteria bacterium]
MSPLYQFTDIEMRFGSSALFHIDELEIHSGRCYLFTGANGTGKTTLLKIMAGLLKPSHCLISQGSQA